MASCSFVFSSLLSELHLLKIKSTFLVYVVKIGKYILPYHIIHVVLLVVGILATHLGIQAHFFFPHSLSLSGSNLSLKHRETFVYVY